MKISDTMILAGAGAIAAALVFWPKVSAAAARLASGPAVGQGDASTIWTAARQSAYRDQLGRELANAGDFWV